MKKNNTFTKILAIAGTVLVWLPLAAPIFFSIGLYIRSRRFMIDYLMPAELFPLVILGSGLLIWAAIRAKSRVKRIGWSFGVAVGLLVLSQVLAVVSGLASGRIEASGIWWVLVITLLAAFIMAVVAIGGGGILLLRDLFHKS
jgi:hypothetical protein